jgi:flagella basal body P-ring formation protein FlgA
MVQPDYETVRDMTKLRMIFSSARLKVMAVLVALGPAMAAQGQTAATDTELVATTQRWLDDAVSGSRFAELGPLKMQVILGAMDSRLKLDPCGQIEPFLPPQTRLWGRTRMGLRCMDGITKWSVFVPVTVKAIGSAWVAKGSIPAGTTLAAEDFIEAEVDWAEQTASVVVDPALWLGQVATRPLNPGQALRQGMFRPAQVFQAGAQVRVVASGAGFQISSDGQALSGGFVGQPARVRMDNGRVMTGVVLDSRTVKVDI